MIISLLNGGLGNQLFQYAAGKSIALFNKTEHKIDISKFLNSPKWGQTPRNLDILDFSITSTFASQSELSEIGSSGGVIESLIQRVSSKVTGAYYLDWHPELFSAGSDLYLRGYFQSEKYFLKYLDKIRDEFKLRSEFVRPIYPLCNEINNTPVSVSVHVRRGDYVQSRRMRKIYDVCSESYYAKAISMIKNSYQNASFFVFSDEINYARNVFSSFKNIYFVSSEGLLNGEVLKPSQELFLMSQCDHNIIANSSFSWWGAYLNQRVDKVVIAPSVWNRSPKFQQPNILPTSWLKIEV